MSFKTDRPVFPYREPDPRSAAESLGARDRLLRIYFIGEARYRGEFTPDQRRTDNQVWTGRVAWTNMLGTDDRLKLLELLRLPATTGPDYWRLTEFEDPWPYRLAPADVTFVRDSDQSTHRREPIYQYVSSRVPMDATVYALGAAVVIPPVWRRIRRRPGPCAARM
jgi:hypothetical protein